MSVALVPVKDGLFTWPSDDSRLLVSKCRACSAATFPAQEYCIRCGKPDCETVPLGKAGRLVSFTSISNRPPECMIDVPYGVGVVEFAADGLRIMGLLSTDSIAELQPGMEMEVVIERIYSEDDSDVVSYRFHPVRSGSAAVLTNT